MSFLLTRHVNAIFSSSPQTKSKVMTRLKLYWEMSRSFPVFVEAVSWRESHALPYVSHSHTWSQKREISSWLLRLHKNTTNIMCARLHWQRRTAKDIAATLWNIINSLSSFVFPSSLIRSTNYLKAFWTKSCSICVPASIWKSMDSFPIMRLSDCLFNVVFLCVSLFAKFNIFYIIEHVFLSRAFSFSAPKTLVLKHRAKRKENIG